MCAIRIWLKSQGNLAIAGMGLYSPDGCLKKLEEGVDIRKIPPVKITGGIF